MLVAEYGHAALGTAPTLVLILVIGATVQGGFNAFYPTMARAYPAELRASGIGYAVGIGRVGAVAGPFVAGWFLAASVPMSTLFLVFSLPLVVSGLAARSLPRSDASNEWFRSPCARASRRNIVFPNKSSLSEHSDFELGSALKRGTCDAPAEGISGPDAQIRRGPGGARRAPSHSRHGADR